MTAVKSFITLAPGRIIVPAILAKTGTDRFFPADPDQSSKSEIVF
jgi:hypothetical protein